MDPTEIGVVTANTDKVMRESMPHRTKPPSLIYLIIILIPFQAPLSISSPRPLREATISGDIICVLEVLTAIFIRVLFSLSPMPNEIFQVVQYKVCHPHPLVFDCTTTFRRISQVTSGKPVICTSPLAVSPMYTKEYIKMNQDGSSR